MTPIALALAGVRIGPLVPVEHASYAQVLVTTPGVPWVTQGTASGGFAVRRFGADLGVTWVATGGRGIADAAVGRLRSSFGLWVGPPRRVFLGLEWAATPFSIPERTTQAWGTRARDTVPGLEVLLVTSTAGPDGTWGVRLALGVAGGTVSGVVADGTLVLQRPIGTRFSLAGELDLCVEPMAFAETDATITARPVVRYTSETGLQVGVGLQLPLVTLAHTITVQPLAQVRWTH